MALHLSKHSNRAPSSACAFLNEKVGIVGRMGLGRKQGGVG